MIIPARELPIAKPPSNKKCGPWDHDWQTLQRYKDGLVVKRCAICRVKWAFQVEQLEVG